MFALPAATAPLALGIGAASLAVIAALYRPLLMIAIAPDLARVQGIPVRLVRGFQLLVLALAVSLSAMTIGAILSTALLIGPAAAALRLTRRPEAAILLAVLIGLGATWVGILLAYDSYDWTAGHGWPVSFFIVALIFVFYVAAEGFSRGGARSEAAGGGARSEAAGGAAAGGA
jgi:zinc/manganese transport system permease protein